jgi:tight adherence protein B
VIFKRRKRLDRFQEVLPEALDLMVNAIRAGHSLIAAMGSVARECVDPVGCEFKTCFEEQNYGLELKTALDNMINRVPLQDLRIVATAIMIQKESGGNLAEVLDKTSHVIRERFRLKRQVATHTAQGRMTGWVLTLLPVVLGVALYAVNPTMMSILWTTAIGVKLLWVSGCMIVVGGLIIRKVVNVDI